MVSQFKRPQAIQQVAPIGDDGTDGRALLVDTSGRILIGAADNAIGRVKITDGTDVALVDGSGNLMVNIAAGSSSGTEYTEGDTDASITGVAVLVEGPSNTLTALQVDASSHLQVDIAASSATVTVDGSGVTQPVSHAALTELAAAIDTEVQVDVVGSLPAGTNAIGKLTANSGVDIGDVDILSIAAGDNNIGNVDVVTLPALAAGTNNIGDVDVLSSVATDYEHGSNLDVDTTAEQLPTQAAKFGVIVKAANANTSSVYVGKSDVTAGTTDATDGFELGAGESVMLPVSNANLLYVIGGAANQKVFWLAC